ncbi:MAG: tRNA pseudouridine(38-40) synthase TruA [Lachnospiraceae bacterium]|nr:tRNA pseudouridine(38-40) synthase TruA [Lachnospiraceae bacterium]
MSQNYKLKIAYDGTRYFGWEHQPGKETIQGKIETVLARMCGLDLVDRDFMEPDCPIQLIGAGRTDAGVHARAMIANVVLDTHMNCDEIRDYMNRYLPDDIAIQEVREASDRFHVRYKAQGKTYQYTLFDGPVKPVFNRKYYTYLDTPIDTDRMIAAAKILEGEHDWKSFCGNSRMKKSTVRNVDRIEVRRSKGYIYVTVHGTGFLQNMVRIIVGTLIEVGYGRMDPEDMETILEKKDRKLAGPTAPAKGLCLLQVDY